jgi:hypothetical protein
VRNEKVLQRVKEERDKLETIQSMKANWIGHILHWDCLLKHIIEGKIGERIAVKGRRQIWKQQLDDIKGKRRNCTLKE